MEYRVRIDGLERAVKQFEGLGRKMDPVMRGTLNTTATQSRSKQFMPKLQKVIPNKAFLRKRLVVKRAGRNRNDSRLIPSSSGIPLHYFADWVALRVAPTRAKIFVRGINGRRLAAGFINPSSKKQLPLRTRGFRGANGNVYKEALGPSLAAFFRQVTNADSYRWINQFLQAEFERRMKKELAKL